MRGVVTPPAAAEAVRSPHSLIQLGAARVAPRPGATPRPGSPNLMANKGDIHLDVSEAVMVALALLSLFLRPAPRRCGTATQPPLPSPRPSAGGTIHHWKSRPDEIV